MLLGIKFNLTLLMLCASLLFASTYLNADEAATKIPDFTMGAANTDYAQRLSEQLGKPVMLLVLARCNGCEKKLLNFQYLATSYAAEDLVTWVIWTPYKNYHPPLLHIPVLNSSLTSSSAWNTQSKTNSLLLINRHGELEHRLSGSLKTITTQAEGLLDQWMAGSQSRPEGL